MVAEMILGEIALGETALGEIAFRRSVATPFIYDTVVIKQAFYYTTLLIQRNFIT